MPKTNAKLEHWVSPLRNQVSEHNGEGWKVQAQSDKVRFIESIYRAKDF